MRKARKVNDWASYGLNVKQLEDIDQSMREGRLVSDDVVNSIALSAVNKDSTRSSVFLLDGYPRTTSQAEFILNNTPAIQKIAVHIDLDLFVAVEKLMGRRTCSKCGSSYNITEVVMGDFDMPAIVPICRVTPGCNGKPIQSVKREDDIREVVEERMKEYFNKTSSVLEVFAKKGLLRRLQVTRGIADIDKLKYLLNDFLNS